jgi:hypothetical protein
MKLCSVSVNGPGETYFVDEPRIWVTLLLGDINTGTWPSRLREYQDLGQ